MQSYKKRNNTNIEVFPRVSKIVNKIENRLSRRDEHFHEFKQDTGENIRFVTDRVIAEAIISVNKAMSLAREMIREHGKMRYETEKELYNQTREIYNMRFSNGYELEMDIENYKRKIQDAFTLATYHNNVPAMNAVVKAVRFGNFYTGDFADKFAPDHNGVMSAIINNRIYPVAKRIDDIAFIEDGGGRSEPIFTFNDDLKKNAGNSVNTGKTSASTTGVSQTADETTGPVTQEAAMQENSIPGQEAQSSEVISNINKLNAKRSILKEKLKNIYSGNLRHIKFFSDINNRKQFIPEDIEAIVSIWFKIGKDDPTVYIVSEIDEIDDEIRLLQSLFSFLQYVKDINNRFNGLIKEINISSPPPEHSIWIMWVDPDNASLSVNPAIFKIAGISFIQKSQSITEQLTGTRIAQEEEEYSSVAIRFQGEQKIKAMFDHESGHLLYTHVCKKIKNFDHIWKNVWEKITEMQNKKLIKKKISGKFIQGTEGQPKNAYLEGFAEAFALFKSPDKDNLRLFEIPNITYFDIFYNRRPKTLFDLFDDIINIS